MRKNIYDELNSDNSSDEENLQNEIVVTPPQSIQISPIVNKHLEYARAVVARSRELAFIDPGKKNNNNTSERGQKRTKCDNCNKTFIRISAHKCKGVKKTFI